MKTENQKKDNIDIFSSFPTKQEGISFFLSVSAFINSWAFMVFIYWFPGLVNQLTFFEITNVLTTILAYCIIEVTGISIFFILIAWILPNHWIQKNFHVRGFALFITIILFFLPFYVQYSSLDLVFKNITASSSFILFWTIFLILLLFFIFNNTKPEKKLFAVAKNFINRISVLGILYLFIDLGSILFKLILLVF